MIKNSTFSLHPYASVSCVNELVYGLNDRFTVHARDGGGARSVQVMSTPTWAAVLPMMTAIKRNMP